MRELSIQHPYSSAEVKILIKEEMSKFNKAMRMLTIKWCIPISMNFGAAYYTFSATSVTTSAFWMVIFAMAYLLSLGYSSYNAIASIQNSMKCKPVIFAPPVTAEKILAAAKKMKDTDLAAFLIIVKSQNRELTLLEYDFLDNHIALLEKINKNKKIIEEANNLINES